ncbi:hypothetical protein AVEN_29282-1 [Araneus ventricosus]|uniref:Uncharacterized protein n=1 Tax=Araneus ventricosus TaxID=182803 RepID=A0A4Y2DM22_ARAVE|nr:hypothetical protein AVEN_29282-1 [Araneus ventricosus]
MIKLTWSFPKRVSKRKVNVAKMPKTGALGRYIPPSATPLIVPTQYIAQIHSILVQQVFFTFHLVSRDAGTEAVACPALHYPRSLLEGCRVD